MSRSLLMMLVLAACGRFGFEDQDMQAPIGPAPLTVTRTDDRMAGPPTLSSVEELAPGSVGLSLREALAIATHRDGADRIGFDASSMVGATILISSQLEVGGAGTEIAARDAGVTIAGVTGYTGTLLRVTGTDTVIDGLALRGGVYAIQAQEVSGMTVRHVTIRSSSSDGIQIDVGSRIVIEDSRIEDTGGDPMFLYAINDIEVQRNFVALRTKMGSVHGLWLEEVNRGHIIDNVIDPGQAFLLLLSNSSDIEVIGNILDRGDTGIAIVGNSQRNLVFRNVVISPTYDSVYLDSYASNNTIVNNTFYQAANIVDGGMNTMAANNLISSNLGDFVQSTIYDFHLVAGHPAIDAATDLGLDMLPDDPARYLGARPDTGAVESY